MVAQRARANFTFVKKRYAYDSGSDMVNDATSLVEKENKTENLSCLRRTRLSDNLFRPMPRWALGSVNVRQRARTCYTKNMHIRCVIGEGVGLC